MLGKKSDKPKSEEAELIERVDAMLSLEPVKPSAVTKPDEKQSAGEPLDIFKGLKKPPIELPKAKVDEPTQAAETAPPLAVVKPEPTKPDVAAPAAAPKIVTVPPEPITEVVTPAAPPLQPAEPVEMNEEGFTDDSATDTAIHEIIVTEGDEVLEAEDALNKSKPPVRTKKKSFIDKLFG